MRGAYESQPGQFALWVSRGRRRAVSRLCDANESDWWLRDSCAYRSAPPALQDMITGDIDYYCPLAISGIRLIENKSVRVLAVLTRERSTIFPDLPTARAQGIDVTD